MFYIYIQRSQDLSQTFQVEVERSYLTYSGSQRVSCQLTSHLPRQVSLNTQSGSHFCLELSLITYASEIRQIRPKKWIWVRYGGCQPLTRLPIKSPPDEPPKVLDISRVRQRDFRGQPLFSICDEGYRPEEDWENHDTQKFVRNGPSNCVPDKFTTSLPRETTTNQRTTSKSTF